MVDVATAVRVPDRVSLEALRRWLLGGVSVLGLPDGADLSIADRLALVAEVQKGEVIPAEEGPRVADLGDEA